jgi:hypothetical protein
MAHFAEIDENNVVLRVVVVPDTEENRGNEFLSVDLGLGGTWIQTSYNDNIRKQFAGIGFTYNPENDVFIRPKPYESWGLDANFDWQPPVPMPNHGAWIWSEESMSWLEIVE